MTLFALLDWVGFFYSVCLQLLQSNEDWRSCRQTLIGDFRTDRWQLIRDDRKGVDVKPDRLLLSARRMREEKVALIRVELP